MQRSTNNQTPADADICFCCNKSLLRLRPTSTEWLIHSARSIAQKSLRMAAFLVFKFNLTHSSNSSSTSSSSTSPSPPPPPISRSSVAPVFTAHHCSTIIAARGNAWGALGVCTALPPRPEARQFDADI